VINATICQVVVGAILKPPVLMSLLRLAMLLLPTAAQTVQATTIVILAKMLVVFGAKMESAEEREILPDALSFQEVNALNIATISAAVQIAMLFQVATGAMMSEDV